MKRGFVLAISCSVSLWSQAPPAIRGRVLDDIAHRGVSRAWLSLAGGELHTPVGTFSDDQGAFQFPEVAAGRYRLSIEKAGFFSETPYGRVDVAANVSTELPEVMLTAKRTISGTIRFRDNAPAFRTDVRIVNVSGGKAGSISRSATANDQGEFAVSDLRPGRYIVYAMSSATPQQERDVFGDFVPAVPGRAAGPTYHSGRSDVSGALDLRTTIELSNIDITLDEAPPGVVVEGRPIGASPIAVARLIDANDPQSVREAQTDPREGLFRFYAVPAGKYILAVPIQGLAIMPLEVGTQPIRGLTITRPEAAPTPGKIEIKGPALKGDPPPPASIRVRSLAQIIPSGEEVAVNPQGEFELNGTRGEVYDLTLSNLPPSIYIAEFKQGDRDLPGGIGVRAGGEPVKVVLKQDGATLEGHVLAGTQPGSKAFVVLAPADRSRRDLYRTAVADALGTFRIQTIAPGSYSVLALERNEDDDYLDPNVFRTWEDRAVAVKLEPSGAKTVELQMVRIR